jgi:uncharacterized protein involved in tellurium resistance
MLGKIRVEVNSNMDVKKLILIFSLFGFIFYIGSGVASANAIEWNAGFVEAEGYGVAPGNAMSIAQGKALAKRAAIVDAYRNLLEVVTGVHVDSETTVQNLMVTNDVVKTRVAGFVKGAVIKNEQQLYDGTYRVTLRVPLYGVQGLQTIIPQINPDLQKFNPEISKIILEKPGDVAEITTDDIRINLNWYQQRKGSIGENEKVDLDLGCFWELKTDKKGIIDPLNKKFGDFDQIPYIKLDNDDRSGTVLTGENLKINGKKMDELKRILVYSYIYDGVAQWAQIDGVITIKQPNKPDIIVRLDASGSEEGTCAIVSIENDGNGKMKVSRVVKYFTNRDAMDKDFGWGFSWHTGTKD